MNDYLITYIDQSRYFNSINRNELKTSSMKTRANEFSKSKEYSKLGPVT